MGPSATELRTIQLFQHFTDAELGELGALFHRVDAKPDQPLFDVDEPADTLYLLTAGDVVLDRPGDDRFKLHPPALIGELGALTNLPRSTRATLSPGAVVWSLSASRLQQFFAVNQELGVRFLANLLSTVADKVHRDQRRMGDMRQNLVRTQKELKRVRQLVLDTAETPLSAPVHDALDHLITNNRRVNYRVEPPVALAANVRLDNVTLAVLDISRTHVSIAPAPQAVPMPVGTWTSGVLSLAGTELLMSGRVHRSSTSRVTFELDPMIEEFTNALEGYLTRVQLLDILC
nr:cyclic nucleotide-binding domain-containing protein [Kofleriaceae bacterium]